MITNVGIVAHRDSLGDADAKKSEPNLSQESMGPLFQVPEDLVCPITHAIFRSPVITTAGTIYEERAIKEHMSTFIEGCASGPPTDPLTNQPLKDQTLTPVFLLKSRAKQFATGNAAACIAHTLDVNCDQPALYLRRACDLCDEADVLDSIPELNPAVVAFAMQHRGVVHDVFLLMHFATALAESGCTEAALRVFSNLLRLEADRPVQIAVVKRCLAHCWGGGGGEERSGAEGGGGAGCWDVDSVAHFVRTQQGLSAGEFVSVLAALGVPRRSLIALARALLHADSGQGPLLAKLVDMVASRLEEDVSEIRATAAAGAGVAPSCVSSHGSAALRSPARAVDAEEERALRLRAVKCRVATGVAVAGALIPGALGRLLVVGPLLWLLRRPAC